MNRILIVDEYAILRKGVVSVLSIEKDIQCIGEAKHIDEALILIQDLKPDLTIINFNLDKTISLELLNSFKKKREQGSKFIFLTSYVNQLNFHKSKDFADGLIMKDALPEELIYAVRLVLSGRKFYDPSLLEMIMTSIDNKPDNLLSELTPKEIEVLSELGLGLTNREIANKLYVTEHTIKKHVSQILDKLDLSDRTQAALYANVVGIAQYQVS